LNGEAVQMAGRAVLWLLAAGLVLSACAAGCRAADRPVAKVNHVLISEGELRRFINLLQLCNPEASPPEERLRSRSEQEILHILIGFELVNQAAQQAGVPVSPEELGERREQLLEQLVQAHYGGSREQLHRRCKELGLALEELDILARYELQASALLERIGASLQEADLLRFVEEHPDLLYQPAAARLYRFRFLEEQEARACLEELQGGAPVEELAAREGMDCASLGWVAVDDPFLSREVREKLFPHPRASTGCVVASGEQYELYWVEAAREPRRLPLAEAREEAALRKKSLLYEQFYYSLWSDGQIEIYLP